MKTQLAGRLTRVTLTGADDSVSPAALCQLSKEFPFVEWGILIGTHYGPRFPSLPWLQELAQTSQASPHPMQLSLHVCGQPLREITRGLPERLYQLRPWLGVFQRCQLNWHAIAHKCEVDQIEAAFARLGPWDPEVIFQQDGVNDKFLKTAGRRWKCSGLFDLSGGRGVIPDEWPMPREGFSWGWAGGLGPKNVRILLPEILVKTLPGQPFWIDMERSLRSEDDKQFELEKCRDVLDKCRPFVSSD